MESRVTYQKKERRKKRLRFRKWVIVVFLIFFLSIFAVSINQVYQWLKDNKEIENVKNMLMNI